MTISNRTSLTNDQDLRGAGSPRSMSHGLSGAVCMTHMEALRLRRIWRRRGRSGSRVLICRLHRYG